MWYNYAVLLHSHFYILITEQKHIDATSDSLKKIVSHVECICCICVAVFFIVIYGFCVSVRAQQSSKQQKLQNVSISRYIHNSSGLIMQGE